MFETVLLAEELTTVPAVVASLSEGEANCAARATVHHLVLHPVVGRRAARLVADRPAEDSTTAVPHQDLTVVPDEKEVVRRSKITNNHVTIETSLM